MCWPSYRQELVRTTPALGEPDVVLKIGTQEFLRHLERAYRRGAQDADESRPIDIFGGDLFGSMFGGHRP